MPLQDRPDYKEWIARRLKRDNELRDDDEKGKEATKCDACGTPAAERQLIGDTCIECLAFEFGADFTHRRIADGIRGIAVAIGSPDSARALVMHGLDRIDELLDDIEHRADAT